MIGHLHWFWFMWLCIVTGIFIALARWQYKEQSAKNGYRDFSGFGLFVFIALALTFCTSALVEFHVPDSPHDKTAADRSAERFKKAGITCAEDGDNDSGNVCRVRLGNAECAVVLPDDDTHTNYGHVAKPQECIEHGSSTNTGHTSK